MSVVLVANDFSAMNVSLPSIEKTFDTNLTTVQWVINIFMLAFAALVVTGGRAADIYGRRRTYYAGAAIFGLVSFLGTFAPDVWLLIGARCIMGVGSAFFFPAVVGLIYATLPRERAGIAGGIVAGSVGIGQVLGPLLGGTLTTELSWRWVLAINLPITLLAMLIIWRMTGPDPESDVVQGIDYVGSALFSIGLLSLLVAFNQTASWGWLDPFTLLLLGVGIGLLVAFIIVERRIGERALIPHEVMDNREFVLTFVVVALLAMPFFVALLYVPQITQKFLGYSAFKAGIGLLPVAITFTVVSFLSGSIYDKIGAKLTLAIGAVGLVLGALWFSFIPDDANYLWLVPGMLIMGVGVGIFFSAATTAAVTSLDPSQSSLGGGLVFMARVAGGSVGIALTTAIFTTVSRNELSDVANMAGISLSESEVEKLDGVLVESDSSLDVLSRFAPELADRILGFAKDAFMSGFQAGMLLNTLLAVAALFIITFFIGGSLRPKQLGSAERAARRRVERYLHRLHS